MDLIVNCPGLSSSTLLLVLAGPAIFPADAFGQGELSPQPAYQTAQDLKRLSIEELAEINITTVSRRVERLAQTAAAISVIRQEDIRRSAATTLVQALRLADGVDVAQVYGAGWA